MCHRSKHRCIIRTSIDKHIVQTIESLQRLGHRSNIVQALEKTIRIKNPIDSTFHNSAQKHQTEKEAPEPEPHTATIQPPTEPQPTTPPALHQCPSRSGRGLSAQVTHQTPAPPARCCLPLPLHFRLAAMMIIHQMRHRMQDNHAAYHVRCAKTSKAGQSRRHMEAKQSETM
jgi:hypothetical protein